MNITHYWVNKLHDFQFRTAALSKPTQWWWALFTVAPTAAGGGTEVVGGSYARVALPPLDANWYSTQGTLSGNSNGTSGLTSNGLTVTFATPTADWGTVNGVGLFDLNAAGNMCYCLDFALASPLIQPIVVLAGEGAVYLPPQAAVISYAA